MWPAFWSNGAGGQWPRQGELDILEYWQTNDQSEVSFHTAVSDTDGCKLDQSLLRKDGCPQFKDVNNWYLPEQRYDCQTDYSKFPPWNGCAPMTEGSRKTGKEYAENPGVIAAERPMSSSRSSTSLRRRSPLTSPRAPPLSPIPGTGGSSPTTPTAPPRGPTLASALARVPLWPVPSPSCSTSSYAVGEAALNSL